MSVGFYASNCNDIIDRFGALAPIEVAVAGWDRGYPNYNNGNAAAVLRALGVSSIDLWSGELSIPTMRQRILVATNRSLTEFEREEAVQYGQPHENEDGTIEIRPIRVMSMGLDSEGIMRRLQELSKFTEVAAECGATHIYWG